MDVTLTFPQCAQGLSQLARHRPRNQLPGGHHPGAKGGTPHRGIPPLASPLPSLHSASCCSQRRSEDPLTNNTFPGTSPFGAANGRTTRGSVLRQFCMRAVANPADQETESEVDKRSAHSSPAEFKMDGSDLRPLDVPHHAQQRRVIETDLSVTTFNILAPIYKRLQSERERESEHRELWLSRHGAIIDQILSAQSSIVCLQEFWVDNAEFAALYEEALAAAGYSTFCLSRTNNRGDGLLAAVKMDELRVKHYHELQFNDCGDRVAQILWLRAEFSDLEGGPPQEFILVNTHLLFPHNAASSLVRIREVYKLLEHLEVYQAWHCKQPTPVILCGDLNGTKKGEVFKFFRSQGFVSSFDRMNGIPDNQQGWISHKNHRGVNCGVDYVWFLNPEEHQPLAANWQTAVFRFLKTKLDSAGLSEQGQIFKFFCLGGSVEGVSWGEFGEGGEVPSGEESSGDESEVEDARPEDLTISPAAFGAAVKEIGTEMELTEKELQELMDFADTDSNGVVDYHEFRTVLDRIGEWEKEKIRDAPHLGQRTILHGFAKRDSHEPALAPEAVWVTVRNARLQPEAVEQGIWPMEYTLSDHAMLTADLCLHQARKESA